MHNGNRVSDTLTLGNRNGGSNHLAASNLGKAKLERIKHLICIYKLYLLGVLEANLSREIQDYECRINVFSLVRSPSNYFKLVCYVRDNLMYDN